MILISANTQLLVCLVVLQITPRAGDFNKLKLASECSLLKRRRAVVSRHLILMYNVYIFHMCVSEETSFGKP